MKRYNIIIKLLMLYILFSGCQKSVLDKTPLDKYSDATLWSDVNLANAYLLNCYYRENTGFTQTLRSSYTDETQDLFGTPRYVQGDISPEDPGINVWNGDYLTIQRINIFIEKVGEIPNAYPQSQKSSIEEKVKVMKGEAFFLRAFCYTDLVRYYGGVPLLKKSSKLGEDFSSVKRASFAEAIRFISDDCDSAAALLPPKGNIDMGKATKGAALALKSRILLFAASDLTADGTALSEYVGYNNPDRAALWKAAKDAAKAVIDMGQYKLEDFGAPDKAAVSQNYYDFFKTKDLSSDEIIWGKMYSLESGDRNQMNHWNGSNGLDAWATNSPTQNLVDSYQMDDGSDFFDIFKLNDSHDYVNVSGKYRENPYYGRDPRFYGSILYDSAIWKKRLVAALQTRDPLGIYARRTRITIKNGVVTSTVYGIDTPHGPISPWNASITGYILKKFLLDDVYWQQSDNDNAWIEFRYAEILLNYAEACIGLGENAEAAIYINKIRNRAAMPDFTGDITKALRYERRIELVFENSRFYDMRRWKILGATLTEVHGMDITETDDDGVITTTWSQNDVEARSSNDKMYWIAIPNSEIKRAPQLTQNPGY